MVALPRLRLWLCLAVAVSGCGGSGGTGSSSRAPTRLTYNGMPVLLQPHPRAVTPVLDKTHAASASIPVSGGSVTAMATDGTTFTVTLSDGALTDPEIVTMTPLSKLEGAPLSVGAIEGVAIEPDGLVLAKPAVLTIAPKAQMAPIAEQVGFGFHDSGTDFFLQHLDAVAGVSLHVMHFSGAGVGGASPGDFQLQSSTPPTQSYDQQAQTIANAVQATIAQSRSAQLQGEAFDTAQLQTTFDNLKDQYYDSVLAPMLTLAESDPAFASDALVLSLLYLRSDQVMGVDSRHYKDVETAWQKIFEKEVARIVCDAARGNATVSQYLGVARQAQALGFPDPTNLEHVLDRCLVFQLDFDSDAVVSKTGGAYDALHIQMHGLRLAPTTWTGQHDTAVAVSARPGACHHIHNQHPSAPFTVNGMTFNMRVLQREGTSPPQLRLSQLALLMHPGNWIGDDFDDCVGLGAPDNAGLPMIDCTTGQGTFDFDPNMNGCWGSDNRSRRTPDGHFLFTEWTYPPTGTVIAQFSVAAQTVLDGILNTSSTTRMTLTLVGGG